MTTNELARLAVWYNHLRDTSNDTFMPLFSCESRYLVLKGGGGSGKSIFAGRKVLERCVSEPGHRFLVCRKVARTLRESCFAQLRGQISEHYPDSGAVVNRGELRIVFPNGSEILFAGLDDVESSNPSMTSPGSGLRRRRSCWRPTLTSWTSACGHSAPTTSR